MITPMIKIELIGPTSLLLPTVDAVQRCGRLHISGTRFTEPAGGNAAPLSAPDPEVVKYRDRLAQLKGKVEEMLNLLAETPGIDMGSAGGLAPVDPDEISGEALEKKFVMLEELKERITGLVKRRLDLKDELASVSRYGSVIGAFAPMLEKLGTTRNLDLVGFTLMKRRLDVLDLLREQLTDMTGGRFEVFTREMDQATLAGVVAVPREFHREVRRLFVNEQVSELRLPESLGDKAPMETLRHLERRLEEIPGEIDGVDQEIRTIAAEHYPGLLMRLQSALEDRLASLSAVSSATRTRMTFILTGWVPRKHIQGFMDFARERLDPAVVVRQSAPVNADLEKGGIPVVLENPPLIRPFELCLRLLPRPAYSSIDPTPFVAIFFPTFFGLILGDVGYGLILLAVSLFLLYKWRQHDLIGSIGVILLACSLSTILFGVLFGELLGDLGIRMGIMKPLMMNRETAIVPSLMLAVGIGVAHIFLGFFIKAWNSIKWKHYGHAVEALATVVLFIALFVVLAAMTGYLSPLFRNIGVVVILLMIPTLIVSGGIVAIMEVFGAFGNMLSYARIMAIGLSSVILAVVANRMFGQFPNVIVGAMIATLVHLVNLVLGVFGPTVHSLRLHYVEFFGKFYKTGSVEYQPLLRKSREDLPAKGGLS
jgi:V/A-type H+-transporting ATPase subunit I